MITYNHEKFIAQAIESVLMQETNFPIELIIGEDCSTDATQAIVRRYAEARPDVVRAFVHERNLGVEENFREVLKACRGKYIALLEGDDYWTDRSKLQTQFEFLEKHRDCALCFHDTAVQVLDPNNQTLNTSPFYGAQPKNQLEFADFAAGFCPHTASCVLVNDRVSFIPVFEGKLMCYALTVFYCVLAKGGFAGFLPGVMSVYRIHGGGIFSSASAEKQIQMDNDGLWPLRQYFSVPQQKRLFTARLAGNYTNLAIVYLRQKHISSFIKSYCCALWLLCCPPNFSGIRSFAIRQTRFIVKRILR